MPAVSKFTRASIDLPHGRANAAARIGAGLGVLLVTCTPAAAAETDCFEQLEHGSAPEIACLVPLALSETEQAELEKGSRGYVKNVACSLTVRIPRRDIEAAITARDTTFQSPEQPVVCSVTTHKSTFDITATFAPRIVIKGDKATEASPGLANVKGITRVISWPVVQFVNRWPSVTSSMLKIVDAYRAHRRAKPAPTPAPAAAPTPR